MFFLLKNWKLVGVFVLVMSMLGAIGIAYKRGKDVQAAQSQVSAMQLQLSQLRKDSLRLAELQAENLRLSNEVQHAKSYYDQVKDPTGCFTTPVPKSASDKLYALYTSISSPRRSSVPKG